MRKQFLYSFVLVLIPTIIFIPAYLYFVYFSLTNLQDYSEIVQGSWTATQYYLGSERVACKDDSHMNVVFDKDTITVSGTVLPEVKTVYSWNDNTSLTYKANGESYTWIISYDDDILKIIVDDTKYIILLRRVEE